MKHKLIMENWRRFVIKESEEKLFSTFEGILKFPVIENFLKPDFHRAFYKNFFKK